MVSGPGWVTSELSGRLDADGYLAGATARIVFGVPTEPLTPASEGGSDDGGCGCRTTKAGGSVGAFAALSIALVSLRRRKRSS